MNCRDCDKPLATNADIDCCHPECDGCAVCEAFCWGNFHSGCPTPIDWRERYDRLRADLAAANRELERWRHGVTIEGDFVCPNELEAVNLRAELERLNKYIATHDEEYATMKETLRAEHQECQRLRALLATPCETEVRWYNNGRGPRVVFEVGSDDYVVTAERAKSIGAALLRAALDADATNDGKGGDRG